MLGKVGLGVRLTAKGRGRGWRTAWQVLHPTGPHSYPFLCSSQQKPHSFSVSEASIGRGPPGKAKRDASLAASPLCAQKASPEPLGLANPACSLLPGHVLTTCSRHRHGGGALSCRAVGRGCISVLPRPLTVRQGARVRTVTAPIFQVAEVKGHHLLGQGSSQRVLI